MVSGQQCKKTYQRPQGPGERRGTSASCSFHVMLTPQQLLLQTLPPSLRSSQTGMEAGVPAVFTCTEMQTEFRNMKPGEPALPSLPPGTKTGLS